MRHILCTLAAAVPILLSAQRPSSTPTPPIVAADAGKLVSSHVPLGEFRRRLAFVKDGQEQGVGTLVERISVQGTGAQAQLVRVQEMTMGQRTIIDTAISVRSTLAPIRHSSKQPTVTMALQFDARRVTGTYTSGSSAPLAIDQTFDVTTFDSNNMELVIGALPLAVGYSARLPLYIYERNGVVWCDITVAGEEPVNGVAAWKLDVQFIGAHGAYWFTKGASTLVKSELTLPSGVTMRSTLVN